MSIWKRDWTNQMLNALGLVMILAGVMGMVVRGGGDLWHGGSAWLGSWLSFFASTLILFGLVSFRAGLKREILAEVRREYAEQITSRSA